MRILELLNALRSVDVPEGQRPASIPRNHEAVMPLKLDYCLFVPVEKALSALQSVQIPNQQAAVV